MNPTLPPLNASTIDLQRRDTISPTIVFIFLTRSLNLVFRFFPYDQNNRDYFVKCLCQLQYVLDFQHSWKALKGTRLNGNILSVFIFAHICCHPGGGHLYFRLDIILIKGLSKHTLNTYFSGVKRDPKYAFLHVSFLICPPCPVKNLPLWPKTHPFFPTLHIFAPLNDIRAYIAWSWKTTLIM